VSIQSVKGIGSKTAQRVILDLKDKALKLGDIGDADEVSAVSNNTYKNEALSALETLGFNRKAVQKVVDSLLKNEPTLSVENIIKSALKKL